jgi:hypothetical protein
MNSVVMHVIVNVANVVPKLSRRVDEELSPKGDALILDKYAIFT